MIQNRVFVDIEFGYIMRSDKPEQSHEIDSSAEAGVNKQANHRTSSINYRQNDIEKLLFIIQSIDFAV